MLEDLPFDTPLPLNDALAALTPVTGLNDQTLLALMPNLAGCSENLVLKNVSCKRDNTTDVVPMITVVPESNGYGTGYIIALEPTLTIQPYLKVTPPSPRPPLEHDSTDMLRGL